jgi:hypothetical protein
MATVNVPAARLRGISLNRWLLYAAIGAGVMNLIVLLGQAQGLVGALYRNPDTAMATVLAGLAGNRDPSRIVLMGNYHYYETWWLETSTRGLPGHWVIWEVIPFVIAFLGIALMAWAAWRAIGLFAAILTTVVMCSLGFEMRQILFTPATHGYTVAHTALLAAALVFLADRGSRMRLSWRLLICLGIALTALSAVAATDQLFEFVSLPSMALAGCLVWWRQPGAAQRKIALFSVGVCGASIAGATVLNSIMSSQHVIGKGLPISFVKPEALFSNLQLTITTLTYLGGGQFFGTSVKGVHLLVFAIGILVLVGVAAVLRSTWRYGSSLGSRASALAPSQEVYLMFWMLTVMLSLGAYVLSSLPVDPGDARYLPCVFAGVAALLPALANRDPTQRSGLAAIVVAFAILIMTNNLIEGTPAQSGGPPPSVAAQVLHFVRAQGADHGYASYYDAPVMTRQTHAALKVYPVLGCAQFRLLCPVPINLVSSWYRARAGVRTFLITDSRGPIGLELPKSPIPQLVGTTSFGPYTVYVYDHDIAAEIG